MVGRPLGTIRTMNSDATTIFQTFPPRALGHGEREVVRDWLAETADIATAYVSERRGDDPGHFRRVVVVELGLQGPSFLVHSPNGTDVWLVTSLRAPPEVRHFYTLRAALNAIRPVLPTRPGELDQPGADWMGSRSSPGIGRWGGELSDGPGQTDDGTEATWRRPRALGNVAGAPRRKLF